MLLDFSHSLTKQHTNNTRQVCTQFRETKMASSPWEQHPRHSHRDDTHTVHIDNYSDENGICLEELNHHPSSSTWQHASPAVWAVVSATESSSLCPAQPWSSAAVGQVQRRCIFWSMLSAGARQEFWHPEWLSVCTGKGSAHQWTNHRKIGSLK